MSFFHDAMGFAECNFIIAILMDCLKYFNDVLLTVGTNFKSGSFLHKTMIKLTLNNERLLSGDVSMDSG
jgi:hypothetical protein